MSTSTWPILVDDSNDTGSKQWLSVGTATTALTVLCHLILMSIVQFAIAAAHNIAMSKRKHTTTVHEAASEGPSELWVFLVWSLP